MCEYTVERAAANLPQSAQEPIFTISGGRVMLLVLIPEITTAIQNQANTTSVYVNPSSGPDTLVWSLGNIQGLAADRFFGYDQGGSAAIATSVVPFPLNQTMVPEGTIDLSCPASNTGQIKWTLVYKPIDAGATVVAA